MKPVDFDSVFFDPRPLEDVLGDCVFALDACVLIDIVVYQHHYSQVGYDALLTALTELAKKKQFFLPAQVIHEFRQNVSEAARNALKSIGNIRSSLCNVFSSPQARYFSELAGDNLKQVNERLEEKGRAIAELLANPWGNDPVRALLKAAHWWNLSEEDLETIKQDAEDRAKRGTPPGCGDSKKDVNAAGDLVIWKSLIKIAQEIDKHLVFVTEDVKEKADWFQVDTDGNPICACRELVEEFAKSTGGRTVHIIRWRQFVNSVLKPHLEGLPEEEIEGIEEISPSPEPSEESYPEATWTFTGPARTPQLDNPVYIDSHGHGWEGIVFATGIGITKTRPFAATGPWRVTWEVPRGEEGPLDIKVLSYPSGRPRWRFRTEEPFGTHHFEDPGRFTLRIEPLKRGTKYRVSVEVFAGH